MLRHPAVAGQFYKDSPEALGKQVREFITTGIAKTKALGILSPHAGLIYSGSVAGAVYSRIEMPDSAVLIGPNHTGLGAPISLMSRGQWETPLGPVEIDEALAASILSRSPHIRDDSLAHLHEHSLEVQLPFLQHFKKDCKIVPIQMMDTRLEMCNEVGKAIGEAIAEYGLRNAECNAEDKSKIRNPKSEIRKVLVVASSDMSHYERADVAKEKDFKAIQKILDLDPQGLYRVVREYGITMCGYGPAVAMLVACKHLGATKAELIKYANSGEVSGEYDQVVGYAGIVVQ